MRYGDSSSSSIHLGTWNARWVATKKPCLVVSFCIQGEGDLGLWISLLRGCHGWPVRPSSPHLLATLDHHRKNYQAQLQSNVWDWKQVLWSVWCPETIFCYREALVSPSCDMVGSFLPWNTLLPTTTTSFMIWSRLEPEPHFILCSCRPVQVPRPWPISTWFALLGLPITQAFPSFLCPRLSLSKYISLASLL